MKIYKNAAEHTKLLSTKHPLDDIKEASNKSRSSSCEVGIQATATEVSAVKQYSLDPKQANVHNSDRHTIPAFLAERTRRPSAVHHGHTHSYPPIPLQNISKDSHHVPVFDEDEVPAAPTQVVVQEVHSSGNSISNLQQERKWKRNARIQLGALYWCLYLEGWNDGSTGPLLPVIQNDYHVGFAIVALLFVANCIGFISGAFVNMWMDKRFGFGKVIVLGAVSQLVAYAILAPAPPFPLMVFAYGIGGFGMSLQNAQANGFVASIKTDTSWNLGMLHAAYGLGAFTSPFLATHFSTQKHWSFHYLSSACIAVTNVAVLLFVFRLKTQEDILAERGQFPAQEPNQDTAERAHAQNSLYRQILTMRSVHFMALFALIYVGVEVTLGGWMVTFVIEKRDGGPTAGYISSGFFGGLTLGRIGLIWLNKLVGERRIIFFYAILSIALEITVWLVPSIVENGVAISCIGILFGPMFPLLVSHATKILPGWLLTGSVGFITSIGVSGSALLPFLTGVLASKFGIGSLQPLMVFMMCLMVVLWALVPKAVRRVD